MNFKKAKDKAQKVAGNKTKLMALLRAVVLKLQSTEDRDEMIAKAKLKLTTFVRMVKAYARGEYKDIPLKSVILVVAGLIYFVNPFDAIPDIIPVVGLMDDAALILLIFNTLGKDIDAFNLWETNLNSANPE